MKPILFIFAIFTIGMQISCLKEPCDMVMCFNGGYCNQGACNCPDNYTGDDCSLQRMPDYIRVNSVQITRFPAHHWDGMWDDGNGPDIFFVLLDDAGRSLGKSVMLFENADATLDYYFEIFVIEMWQVTSMHKLQLWDYEGFQADHQLIGEVSFIPYHETNGFPSGMTVDTGGSVAFNLTYEYGYAMD